MPTESISTLAVGDYEEDYMFLVDASDSQTIRVRKLIRYLVDHCGIKLPEGNPMADMATRTLVGVSDAITRAKPQDVPDPNPRQYEKWGHQHNQWADMRIDLKWTLLLNVLGPYNFEVGDTVFSDELVEQVLTELHTVYWLNPGTR